VASALEEPASASLNLSLSEQDFHFCKAVLPGFEASCSEARTLEEGLVEWVNHGKAVTMEKCLPYAPKFAGNGPCSSYLCKDTQPTLSMGTFLAVKSIGALWEAQDHIREHGSIICNIDIYDDFEPFFKKHPKGVYAGPSKGFKSAEFIERHAVQVIGYNNVDQFWISKNSWGTDFADGGFFRVKFGHSSMCYQKAGLKFLPRKPVARAVGSSISAATIATCVLYKPAPTDYISKLSRMFQVSMQRLLLDNLAVIEEPDMYLGGVPLLVCSHALAGHIVLPRPVTTTIRPDNGLPFGVWLGFAQCPKGTWAASLATRVESREETTRTSPVNDDSALNAVSLGCSDTNGRHLEDISPDEGLWGAWSGHRRCPGGAHIVAVSMQVHAHQGPGVEPGDDDTAVNALKARCSDGTVLYNDNSRGYGSWSPFVQCPTKTAVCGLKVRFLPSQGGGWQGDDTAVNDIEFQCCAKP
jgi:hypothetical protein